jgi:trk system potassium uptake protein TrkA
MKSFIVLGLGHFGKSIAQTLFDLGHEVLAVDDDERIVQEFSRHVTHTVQAEVTSEDFLKSMDIKRFDAVIVAVGSNMQVSIMATVLLKELGAKFILVKAQDDFQEKVLYKIGADKVILPEKDMGVKAARSLAADNFYDMIEISPEYSIVTIHTPVPWYGKTLGELAVRAKYGVNIIAVKGGKNTNVIPNANTMLDKNTAITVMGSNYDLKRLNSIK